MLKVFDYLLISESEPSTDACKVCVEFDAAGKSVPVRFIRRDVLKRLKADAAGGSPLFFSFDEHPQCVLGIEEPQATRAAVISVRQITDADGFPDSDGWLPVGLQEIGMSRPVTVSAAHQYTARPLDGLRIGTLSSELRGNQMRITESGGAVEGIMAVIDIRAPDVLLLAGYALHDDAELCRLNEALRGTGWDGLLFIEVRNSDGSAGFGRPDGAEGLCLFAWTSASGMKPLARQVIATSSQAQDMRRTGMGRFDASLAERTVLFRGLSFGVLICGEINVLQGRNAVQPLTPSVGAWLDGLDVLVNPTHDLMGNAGTLIAKRRHVSRDDRLYVSASNWNSRKPVSSRSGLTRSQNRGAATLHTAFRDGQPLSLEPFKVVGDMEYRETVLSQCVESAGQVKPSPRGLVAKSAKVATVSRTYHASSGSISLEDRTSERPRGRAALPFWSILQEVFSDVQCERRFPWLAMPKGNAATGLIGEARAALIAHCGATQLRQASVKKRACGPDLLTEKLLSPHQPKLEFDFFVPSLNLAFEFDERQHFTPERLVTLELCEGRLDLDFPISEWKQRCARIAAVDPEPIWRDWQRAYRDVARDILAAKQGILLIRVAYDAPASRDDLVALKTKLACRR